VRISNSGTKGEVHIQVFGSFAGTFYLIGDYEGIPIAPAMQAQILADEKCGELLQQLADVMSTPQRQWS
jgi:hypothetical protein